MGPLYIEGQRSLHDIVNISNLKGVFAIGRKDSRVKDIQFNKDRKHGGRKPSTYII